MDKICIRITRFVDFMVNSLNSVNVPIATAAMHFGERISRQHNTLQQAFIRFLYIALKHYAKHTIPDTRNWQAVNWAKEATDIKVDFPYI